jgi:hypothetical protein
MTSESSRPAWVGAYVDPGPSGLGRISITPARSNSFNRFESRPRDKPGAPSAISLYVRTAAACHWRATGASSHPELVAVTEYRDIGVGPSRDGREEMP